MTHLSAASTNARAPVPGLTARAAGRRLLPVAAMAAVVALMIRGGIARNQERIRATSNDLERGRDTIHRLTAEGARFLAAQQAADGSWAYSRSRSPLIVPAEGHPGAASTMRILLGVRGTGHERQPFYAAGLDFVRAHRERAHGASPAASDDEPDREPAIEALSLAWLLLGPDARAADELRACLRGRQTLRGLYRGRLSDNVLLLGVLPALGLDARPLSTALRRTLAAGGPEPSPSWTVIRYLGALAGEPGLAADALGPGGPLPTSPAQLDSLTLAAHVKVRAEECLRERDPCTDLNAAVGTLVQRRRPDGSWTVAPFAAEGAYFTGSAAETTSVAVSGLSAFARVLDGRASGALISGEEDESRFGGGTAPSPAASRRR
jgi:hypothetical protein